VAATSLEGIWKGLTHLKSYYLFLASFAVILLAIQGCKETPNSVGYNILPPGDRPNVLVDTFYASSYSTISKQISTFGSDRLLVGKYSGYDAMSTIRFAGLPAGLLDTVSVINASISLHAVYHFGDAAGPLAFRGFALIASSDSANYDSLTTLAANYYSSNPILVYSPAVLDDTSTIQCAIDSTVVRNWFATSPSLANYGLILVATNVTTIKGFGSFLNPTTSYVPELIINYTSSSGNTGTVTYSSGVSRFIANVPLPTILSIDPQSMFAQSGVAYRAELNFGLRSIPKAGLILKADLELTANGPASNLNSFAADTLYSYFVQIDSTIAAQQPYGQTITTGGNKIYRFAVVDFVRTWANGDTLQRLQFGGLRETSSLDLFALYGTTSSYAVRPRLIITHILQ
jgi:hypothetical protein